MSTALVIILNVFRLGAEFLIVLLGLYFIIKHAVFAALMKFSEYQENCSEDDPPAE